PFYSAPLVPQPGFFAARVFFSATCPGSRRAMADLRRATRVRFLAVVLEDRVSVSASLLAAAPLRGTRFSCLPTILAWELGLRVRSLSLGERWAPWARIWNGSNSAFLCWISCNG